MRSALIPEGQCGGWTFLTRCLNATTVPVVSETLLDTALTASKQTSRSKVLAWAMWDWGTQPFNTVITTFVFSVYITSAAFGEVNHTSRALAVSTTIGGLVVALLAPVLGQMTDRSGRCVTVLRGLTWSLSLISMSLFLVAPQPDFLWFGLGALAVGSVISEIAGASYNSLIEQVASDKDVGLVSGFGWGMGYLGGIVVLVLLFFGFISPEVGLFGVSDDNGMDVRVSMVVCGLWTLVFTIPTFVKLKDPPRTESVPVPGAERWAGRRPELIWLMLAPVLGAYAGLIDTVRRLWATSRSTVWFLIASALFRDGLAGVFAFGAVIASGTFGFSSGQVVIFGAAANIVAGVSTIIFGLLDDRIGPKKVIILSLIALIVFGTGIFVFHAIGPGLFWVAGLGMCLFVGPAQSASRSFLARMIPLGKSGEVFGLYATTGRVASFLSPLLFGVFITIGGWMTGEENTQYWGILGIVVVLLIGLLAMIRVRENSRLPSCADDKIGR